MTKIFVCLPGAASGQYHFPRHAMPKMATDCVQDLIQLYQVCRHWRRILHSYPPFWSTVVLAKTGVATSDRFIEYFLARSGTQLIDVFSSAHRGLGEVAKQSHRLQRLDVIYKADALLDLMAALEVFGHPAPHLESLECGPEFHYQLKHPNATQAASVRLPVLFGGDAPQLRKLRLAGIGSWTGNRFPSMTHLDLIGWKVEEDSFEGFQDLLDLLHHSPVLESFYLSLTHPWIPRARHPESDTEGRLVYLDKIRRLCFVEFNTLQLNTLLSRLQIPAVAALSVEDLAFSNAHAEDVDIFAMFARHAARLGNVANLHSLEVVSSTDIVALGPSGSVRVEIAGDFQTLALARFIDPNLLLWKTIQELFLVNDGYREHNGSVDWFTVLVALPLLKKLSIRKDTGVRTIFSALARTSSPQFTEAPRVVCKQPHSVWILESKPMAHCNAASPYYDILLCAEVRLKNGHPFRYIGIEPAPAPRHEPRTGGVDWSDAILRSLKQYVETVEFETTCPAIEIPPELDTPESADSTYWPKWSP